MWFGGQIVLNGDNLMSVKSLLLHFNFSQIIPPARSLTSSFTYPKGSAAAQRIMKLMKKILLRIVLMLKVSIQFKINYLSNVSFKYQSLNVLNGIILNQKVKKSHWLVNRKWKNNHYGFTS